VTCRCAPALIKLAFELNVLFRDRDRLSDGCCASPSHTLQNPLSRHEPAATGIAKGYARARDIDEDLAPGVNLVWLWESWRRRPDARLRLLIYEGVYCHPNSATDRSVYRYDGPNAHESHLHAEIVDAAVLDTSSWQLAERWADAVARLDATVHAPDSEREDPAVADPRDIVGILYTNEAEGPDGQIPHLRVRRNGDVEAVNGAFDGRAFPGSLASVNVHRADVNGIIERGPRDSQGRVTGYTLTTDELIFDSDERRWESPTYTFSIA
jgi:hypothetical protein